MTVDVNIFDYASVSRATRRLDEYYADLIENKTLPNSSRWFTFDIERLDEEWFIWTYTYPNGRKDSWEMKRSQR